MTREEQILNAALDAGKQPLPIGKIWNSPLGNRVMSAYEIGFLDGAEWADEHPKQKPIKWSDEDEENFQHCLLAIKHSGIHTAGDIVDLCKWLQSKKQRMEEQQ